VLILSGLALLPAAIVLLGCAGSLFVLFKATASRSGWLAAHVQPSTLALCALTALALCVLGGEGHLFFANYDWLNHDAVLADLVRHPFPVLYDYQGSEFVLRAPLGMYAAPATIGKLWGLHAAHLALLGQNVVILTLILTVFVSLAPARNGVFLFVFVTFSGIEIVARLIEAAATYAASGTLSWPVRAHQHLEWWNPLFQYTGNLTQIFWVPHHAFPGWWLAALCVLHVRREIDSAILIVAFAFLFFWSPLVAAGAMPIAAYLVLRRDFARLLAPRLLIAAAAALCFLPLVLYLGADAGSVPHFWLFVVGGFWIAFVAFIVIQIPQAAVVWAFRRALDPRLRELVAVAVVLLLLIPLYRLGPNNDFTMRASIMPLALLAFVFASIAADLELRDGIGRVLAVATIVALSAVTPGLEIQRALMLNAFAISDYSVLTNWHNTEASTWMANYLARLDRIPAWLLRNDRAAPPIMVEQRQCWPDHPFIRMKIPMNEWREPTRW
jgi:hypothetical protein